MNVRGLPVGRYPFARSVRGPVVRSEHEGMVVVARFCEAGCSGPASLYAMGYVLAVHPLIEGLGPSDSLSRLVAEAERSPGDSARGAVRQRLAASLVAAEPMLEPFRRGSEVTEEIPELSSVQNRLLARSLSSHGLPGIQVELGDEWATLEIATWPQLADPIMVERTSRLLTVIARRQGGR